MNIPNKSKPAHRMVIADGYILARINKHIVYKRKDGAVISISCSPSCKNWLKNVKKDLERNNRKFQLTH
jgi:hypothetical protein